MAMRIKSEDCINCAACEADCPSESIAAGDDTYVVNEETCTECKGTHDSPHCIDVCPIDGCIVAAA
jgi:ferredoxin